MTTRQDPPHLPAVIERPAAGLPAVGSVDVLAAWLSGRKATTLRAYTRDIEDFARFLGQASGAAAVELLLSSSQGDANAVALAYRADMIDRKLASATVARRLAALRSVVKCGRILGRVPWMLDIDAPKATAYRDTIACGESGWRALLTTARTEADDGAPRDRRNVAIITLLHDVGLRRGEVCSLDVHHFDPERSTVSVMGKGRTERITLTLPVRTVAALRAWLEVHPDPAPTSPLFVRLDPAAVAPGRLTGEAVRLIVAELARKAELAGPVRPHGIRHLAVTAVLDRNNGDIRAAAEFARHSDPKVTMRYDRNRRDLAGQMARLIAEDC